MRNFASILLLCGTGSMAVAQSQPTPGAPSQPFAPVAQAQNGGAGPQVTYQYGMEFVTIPGGGSAYAGLPGDVGNVYGRGGLNYAYRIGRYEVDGAQWGAFFAAADAVGAATGQPIPYLSRPGSLSSSGPRGRAGNISWWTAAMYANWLCNDQQLTRSAFMNGAYDVSTFGLIGNGYTDQLTHNADARFWIPTLDEWIRAAHYDPNRNGHGQEGWWQYAISRDTMAGPGLPGHAAIFPFFEMPGEANAGFSTPNLAEFGVPLGAYSNIQSPWGLFDTIGQTTEWLEEPLYLTGPNYLSDRMHAGAYITGSLSDVVFGSLGADIGASFPLDNAYWIGFRIAALVPTPASGILLLFSGILGLRRGARPCTTALSSACSRLPLSGLPMRAKSLSN